MKVEPRRGPQIRMIITKMDYLKKRTVLKSMIIVIMRPEETIIITITITMIIKFYH